MRVSHPSARRYGGMDALAETSQGRSDWGGGGGGGGGWLGVRQTEQEEPTRTNNVPPTN